jgi:hypothetical protein
MVKDSDKLIKELLPIIGWVVGIGLILLLARWLLPPIIKAIGAAVGIAGGIIGGTLVGSTVVATWLYPVAAAGLGAIGFSGAYIIVVKVVKTAESRPYMWALPALSILTAFLIDLCKDFYITAPLKKVVFSAIAAVFVAVGGVLMTTRKTLLNIIGFLMHLMLPLIVILGSLRTDAGKSLKEAIVQLSIETWTIVLILVIIPIVIAVLARSLEKK